VAMPTSTKISIWSYVAAILRSSNPNRKLKLPDPLKSSFPGENSVTEDPQNHPVFQQNRSMADA
jgi:hypothetical protein